MNKLIIFTFVLLLTISVSAQRNNKSTIKSIELKQSYDRFKDATIITLWIDIKPNFSILFVSGFDNKKPISENNLVSIVINSKSKDLFYRYSNDLDFLLDGNRLSLDNGKYSVERSGNFINEGITYFYFQDTLKKIIEAKKVEAKIGDTEFTFTEKQLESIRDFYKKLIP